MPVFGQKVFLDPTRARSFGNADLDVTLTLPEQAAHAAISASMALELPFSGVDVIINDQDAFVLEANSRAIIAGSSFPSEGSGAGNAVAEAIVDHYFPSNEPIKRDSLRLLSFEEVNRSFERDGVNTVFALK